MEQFRDELVEWVRNHVAEAGARGTVVGLSGGIDSAVVAALCQRAFPESNLGVIMPCDSTPIDATYARLLAERIGMRVLTVDLTSTWQGLCEGVEQALVDARETTLPIARANVKPRLRMTTLYYVAARFNYLVVGTDNLPEIAIGYSTKFGDGAADLMPLGNLLKREVTALAQLLDVPQEIIDRPPTAGLWEGQTDEDEMGVSYEVLDNWLATGDAPEAVRERLETMHRRSHHKRTMPPVGPAPKR